MPAAKKSTKKTTETAATPAVITAYKGFGPGLKCINFQYEVGQTYRHEGKVVCCPNENQVARGEGGFHACEHPLNVFRYYAPATSRFAIVELGGKTARENGGDTKIAAAEITIKAEIKLPELIKAAVKYVMDRVTWVDGDVARGENEGARSDACQGAASASGTRGAATASGWQGAATASGTQGAATASGDWGAATASGRWGAATASGTRGAATASGWQGAATASGTRGAATASGAQGAATASGAQGAATASGERSAATASGWQGAATASGDWGAATASGAQGAATASGWQGAATASGAQGAATASGERSAATASGWQGAATASGFEGKARGAEGCALFLVERQSYNGKILHVWAGIAGRDGIKPNTFYRLADGKPIEVA